MNRRNFIRGAGVLAASTVFPNFAIASSGRSANNKLNVAVIGAGGRGRASINALVDENLVAFCDVDEKHRSWYLCRFSGRTTLPGLPRNAR